MPGDQQDGLSVEELKTLRQNVIAEKVANEMYLRRHPEVLSVLSEATRLVLLRRPDDPVAFVSDLLASANLAELAAMGAKSLPG
jgi:hypothetical protein